MLDIKRQNKSFLLKESASYTGIILSKPLHKLFLKNYLNGLSQANGYWKIPEDSIDNLILILSHFNKYNIIVNLDDQCQILLEEKNKDEENFKQLINQAIKAKQKITESTISEINTLLSPEFKRTLTHYQLQAANHLISIQNGANFSVPGSGKTTIALAYYHILKKLKIVERLFIIGPASVFEPWETEYFNCFNVKPSSIRIAGNQKFVRKSLYLTVQKTEIFLNTYHSASRDIQDIISLFKLRKFLLILDESHYVKKPTGGKLSDTILELSKYATRKIILTGTPMPNGLADLWSQISFLWIDQLPLGTTNRYLNMVSSDQNKKSFELVKSKIFPFFFRITKSQLGLPVPKYHFLKCNLSPLQSLIYKGVVVKFLNELKVSYREKQIFRELRRARAIRLLQIASNPSLLKSNCEEFLVPPFDSKDMDIGDIIDNYPKLEIPIKFKTIDDLASNIINKGEKVVIWSMFVHNLFMLNNLLTKYNPVVIYGGIPYVQEDEVEISRESLIKRFKTDDDCKILIANPAACAESISLHKVCHNAIYLDRSFNCAHYIQSLDRIHRLGLKNDDVINYYIVMVNGTIDEIVNLRLFQKIENLNNILEGDFPGIIPGYWNNDLGEEEDLDYNLVDNHICQFI